MPGEKALLEAFLPTLPENLGHLERMEKSLALKKLNYIYLYGTHDAIVSTLHWPELILPAAAVEMWQAGIGQGQVEPANRREGQNRLP